jgi:glycosyltransferase involved in cell wall biosynthesis
LQAGKSVKKILFLAAHRLGRSPGQRFRFEQYLPALKEAGFECEVSYLLNAEDDVIFYSQGHYLQKLRIYLKTLRIRKADVKRAKDFDIVFLYREAVMTGSVRFERLLAKQGARMVLDFDDAIWLHDVSDANRRLGWLKRPEKTADIIALCKLVITGNNYLASYASAINPKTVVVPTTIETDQYALQDSRVHPAPVCIGWTGSTTTVRHLKLAKPILMKLKERFGEAVTFRVIADKPWEEDEPVTHFIKWKRESEVEDLSAIDIGIMPLPDNDWARGKCGFKGLQYMALGIPAVMSPVGVNTEIIQDGVNGFLAATEDEWVEKLSLLINDAALRKRIGAEGRKTVEERYSYNAWKDRYVALFSGLLNEK